MSGGRLVGGALAVAALGIGVLIGLAAPRDDASPAVTASLDPTSAPTSGAVSQRDQWVSELAGPAVQGRIDGLRVAMLVADGTPADAVERVEDAINQGGGTVVASASLGSAWWDPDLATFRSELADQLAETVVGVPNESPNILLQHAIAQALLPGAQPSSQGDQPEPSPSPENPVAVGGEQDVSTSRVLLDSLERGGIVTVADGGAVADGDADAGDAGADAGDAVSGADAVVIVTGDGPEGGGMVAARAVGVWEQYVSTSLVVVTQPEDASEATPTALEARDAASEVAASARPSVVLTTVPVLVAPQVVLALAEQREGGAGEYGTFEGLAAIPNP